MSLSNKLQTIAENQQRIYDAGASLKDNKPYLDTSKITKFNYFNFEGPRTNLLDKLDTSNGVNFWYFCKDAKDLVTVDVDFSKATQATQAFHRCTALETIVYLDLSSIPQASGNIYAIFGGCSALKNITMKPNCVKANISFADSPLLTDESIQSIIDGLATVTSGLKLTLHSDVIAKLTDEQVLQINNKGWEIG